MSVPVAPVAPVALPAPSLEDVVLSCPAGTTRAEIPARTETILVGRTSGTCTQEEVYFEEESRYLLVCGERHFLTPSTATAACFDDRGRITGEFIVARPDRRHSGACRDDVPDGEWRDDFEGGMEVTTYRAGRKHGPHRMRLDDGTVTIEGLWRDGVEDGTWLWRDKTRAIVREQQYRAGVTVALRARGVDCGTDAAGGERCAIVDAEGKTRAVGTRPPGQDVASWTVWYPSGQRFATFSSRGSIALAAHSVKPDGPLEVWYPSGRPMVEGNCIAGQRHGLWRSWYPDGQPRAEVEHSYDSHQRSTRWHRDGTVETGAKSRAESNTLRASFTDWTSGCLTVVTFAKIARPLWAID